MATFPSQGSGRRRWGGRRADDLAVKAALERTRAALLGTSPELPKVGRFEIHTRLGRGGMGVVYAAHDPALDRQLALKIVDVTSEPARDRVLFEARAQARVSHRHVVPIFEVEDHGDKVAIAMEHMVGGDLTTWLAAAPRSWRRIVSMFIDAGRGLAAAHASGLVHGDFKPDNVLLDGDAVPRVADFGLARLASDPTIATGSGGGTPGYLAPEVLAGAPATAASDQYAFAVSLFEALHGQRPTTLGDAPRRSVPSWIDRILARGLAAEPMARFPSVDALVDALAEGLARGARRRRIVVAASTLIVGAALAFGATALSRTEDVLTCSPDADALAAAWTPERAAAVTTAFAKAGRPFAGSIVGPATHALAAYRDRLGALARTACQAADADPALRAGYAEQARCFDQALTAVTTVAEVWTHATPEVVDHALEVTQALPLLERCSSTALARRAPRPTSPKLRALIAVAVHRLTVATAAERAGVAPHALDELRAIVATSEQLGYAPLVAAAHNAYGHALAERYDPAAPATFEAALVAASAGRDDEAFVSSGLALWHWRLLREGSARADSLAPVIRAMALSLGDRHVLGQVSALESETRRIAGDGQGCLVAARAALANFRQVSPVDAQAIARAQLQLANCHRSLGDAAPARLELDAAERTLRSAFGSLHPDLALLEAERALLTQEADGVDRAEPIWREAIARARAAYGGDSEPAFDLATNLASALVAQGRFDDADQAMRGVEEFQRQHESRGLASTLNVRGQIAVGQGEVGVAIAAHEEAARRFRAQGDLVMAGNAINALGNALRSADRLPEAAAAFQESLELMEQLLGADHPRVAIALSNLGEMALLQRDARAAETFCRRALAIDEAHMAADNPALAYDLTCLGAALVATGATADSLPLLERALALRTSSSVGDLELGQTHLALAQALWSRPDTRAKAHQYARLAVAELARANAPAERLVAETLVAASKR